MDFVERLRSARDSVRQTPVVGAWLEQRYRRKFARLRVAYLSYCGVYPDFASALAAAPDTLPTGFDDVGAAQRIEVRARHVLACDYPAMFWLQRLFDEGRMNVFDLGGGVGVKYYAFRPSLAYPPDLHWTVGELPAVASAGAQLAATQDPHRQLAFTDRPADAEGADVLFTSGCLQYLDYTLADLLGPMARRPEHVLVNVLPLHPTQAFWTVQHTGDVNRYCAYGIAARPAFLAQFQALGYALRDDWDQDRQCVIPFHPDCRVDRYHGFLFSRARA